MPVAEDAEDRTGPRARAELEAKPAPTARRGDRHGRKPRLVSHQPADPRPRLAQLVGGLGRRELDREYRVHSGGRDAHARDRAQLLETPRQPPRFTLPRDALDDDALALDAELATLRPLVDGHRLTGRRDGSGVVAQVELVLHARPEGREVRP